MKWQTLCPRWLIARGTAKKSAAMNHVPAEAARSIKSAVEDDTSSHTMRFIFEQKQAGVSSFSDTPACLLSAHCTRAVLRALKAYTPRATLLIFYLKALRAASFGRTPSALYRLWIHTLVDSVLAEVWFLHRFYLNGAPHQSPQLLNFLIQFWCGLSVTSCSCLDLCKVLILLSQRKLLFSLSHNDSFPLRSHSCRKVCTRPCCSYMDP